MITNIRNGLESSDDTEKLAACLQPNFETICEMSHVFSLEINISHPKQNCFLCLFKLLSQFSIFRFLLASSNAVNHPNNLNHYLTSSCINNFKKQEIFIYARRVYSAPNCE